MKTVRVEGEVRFPPLLRILSNRELGGGSDRKQGAEEFGSRLIRVLEHLMVQGRRVTPSPFPTTMGNTCNMVQV